MRNAQFGSLTKFTLTGDFKAGVNTLEFAVNNAGTEANQTGLRLEGLRLGGRPAVTVGPRLTLVRDGSNSRSSGQRVPRVTNCFQVQSWLLRLGLAWAAVNDLVIDSGIKMP
ncbi:MAG: hypothetical protein L0Z50_34395 [Verrucomicrobiales bacterium]|nr:hypothetical protein [Verrucomicrobiales bacterium]